MIAKDNACAAIPHAGGDRAGSGRPTDLRLGRDFTPEEQRGKQLYREGVGADGSSPMATIGQGSVTLSATKVPAHPATGLMGSGDRKPALFRPTSPGPI